MKIIDAKKLKPYGTEGKDAEMVMMRCCEVYVEYLLNINEALRSINESQALWRRGRDSNPGGAINP